MVVLQAYVPVVIDSVIQGGSDPDWTITVYVTAEATPLEYAISGASIVDSISNDMMVKFSDLPAGHYTITVTDNVGNIETYPDFILDVIEFGYRSLLLYPNPSNGQFTIEMENEKREDLMLEILNISGQLVYQKLHKYDGQARFIRTIDLGEQAKGTYFMRMNGLPVKAKLMID